ncbi:MAG: CPBP family intramembrane metalloprotease [Oscillospiraceae bacterium]|nr:CPBP family intramembrane metalloprotease [Oscillospiraceae bacterium]
MNYKNLTPNEISIKAQKLGEIRKVSSKMGVALAMQHAVSMILAISLKLSFECFVCFLLCFFVFLFFYRLPRNYQSVALIFLSSVVFFCIFCMFFKKNRPNHILVSTTLTGIIAFSTMLVAVKFKKLILFLLSAFLVSVVLYNVLFVDFDIFTKQALRNAANNKILLYVGLAISNMLSMVVLSSYLISKQTIKMGQIFCFKRLSSKALFYFTSMGLFVSFFANMASSVLVNNLRAFGFFKKDTPDIPIEKNPAEILVFAISVSLVPAIFEEIAFRGVVLGSLRRYGDYFAVLVSSLLFAMVHKDKYQVPFAFVLGLVLGSFLVETNSIFPSMLIHFFNNFFSCVLSLLKAYSKKSYEVFGDIYILIVLILGIISFFKILKLNPNFLLKDKNSPSFITTKERIQVFFFGGSAFLLLIIFIFLQLLFFLF